MSGQSLEEIDPKPAEYTRRVIVTTATDELSGFVHPDHDLSDLFTFWDEDLNEMLTVKGHLAEVNDDE